MKLILDRIERFFLAEEHRIGDVPLILDRIESYHQNTILDDYDISWSWIELKDEHPGFSPILLGVDLG